MSAGVTVPIEAIVTVQRRLAALPARHPERQPMMASTAGLYGISRATLYRLLRGERCPREAHRADRGLSCSMPAGEIEWWYEVVAAMKSVPAPVQRPSAINYSSATDPAAPPIKALITRSPVSQLNIIRRDPVITLLADQHVSRCSIRIAAVTTTSNTAVNPLIETNVTEYRLVP